jgi:type I restriction enzyme S subunit
MVKAGYKQTEVGIIPEDWELTLLSDATWFQEGPGLRNWQFRSNGLKVINVTNLQENGYLDLSTTSRHISWVEFEQTYKHFLIDEGDVVMASSGNSYCKTASVRSIDLPLLMNTSVIRFKAKEKIDRLFMLVYLKSKYFKLQIDLMITGGAQPNFGPFHLKRTLIPLPPTLGEQRAIAEALSDADALIESLEQLIAKKRAIKQGAMQELLQPKEGWVKKKLGELFNFSGGYSASRDQLSSEGHFYLHYGDIHASKKPFINVLNDSQEIPRLDIPLKKVSSSSLLEDGDVVFVDASEDDEGTSKHVVINNRENTPFISGLHTIVAKSKTNELAQLYKQYCFQTTFIKRQFYFFAVGTKVSGISKSNISKIDLIFPSDKKEQAAIANILSDMDTEIAALEAKLSKAQQLKQAMMQELLTGKTRLVELGAPK